jgi:phosphoribosylaminoimidazole-succinocarboxamide synthase
LVLTDILNLVILSAAKGLAFAGKPQVPRLPSVAQGSLGVTQFFDGAITVEGWIEMSEALLKTKLPGIELHARGKVRDIYKVGDDLLLVATDRISAFDHVLASGIPGKGKILNQISLFWFDLLSEITPNHLITANVDQYPPQLQPFRDQLELRSMLVRRAEMFPVECVVRGYLSGSAWQEYRNAGSVCGIHLPAGLEESARLPEPLFTPATKAEVGSHDINISTVEMGKRIGAEITEQLMDLSLSLYRRAAEHAEGAGLILADTKFEFGRTEQGIVLADEALTPDSSRYWPQAGYRPGGPQPSFDKQFVRDYLIESGWNRQAPAPALPDDVVARTREKYLEAFRRITGRSSLDSDSKGGIPGSTGSCESKSQPRNPKTAR